ncbi:MAG: hypothetical protein ACLQBA_21200 [Candidatus Binataceae bacterium]
MKFGMLYEIETPRPWSALSEYNIHWQALAQIELADRIGATHTLGSRRRIPAEAGFAV